MRSSCVLEKLTEMLIKSLSATDSLYATSTASAGWEVDGGAGMLRVMLVVVARRAILAQESRWRCKENVVTKVEEVAVK